MPDRSIERRALLALYRNHPATAPGDRYNWKARAEASRNRDMLLGWAATQTDETLLHCRNLGTASLAWIREQTGDPQSPFADLEDENADLRMALGAASEELARLRKAAQAVVDWYDGPPYVYLEEEMVRQVDVLRAVLRSDTDAPDRGEVRLPPPDPSLAGTEYGPLRRNKEALRGDTDA